MPQVQVNHQYHHSTDFDRGKVISYCDIGVSYREITHLDDSSETTTIRV